jgi:hypothetical protein
MPTPNTLADIRTKVRRLTARSSQQQITDAEIDNYVNTYYLYDMPESLRLLKLKDIFTFTTEPHQEFYPFDNLNYITVEPPCYVSGQQINYFQDLDTFYREWPKINYTQIVANGNGTAGPYTGVITGTPFMQSIYGPAGIPPQASNIIIGKDIRVLISGNQSNFAAASAFDDGNGGFIDAATGLPLVGNIDYITGAFTVTLPGNIPAATQINASVIPYVASLPRAMCLYQNQFMLRPIPDKAYIVEINAFRYPTALAQVGDRPELDFWWQLLAFGAARKILIDNADFENATNFEPYFLEQLAYVQRRTIKLLSTQRSSTIYSNASTYPYSNLYPYI